MEGENGPEDKQEDELSSSGLYRPPRIAPVVLDDDSNRKKSKKDRDQQRMLQKATRSRLIQDLMVEFDERPEEETATGGARASYGENVSELREKERTEFEESNFTRLQLTKKDKQEMKRHRFSRFEDEFKSLSDFNNIAAIKSDDGHFALSERRNRQKEQVS